MNYLTHSDHERFYLNLSADTSRDSISLDEPSDGNISVLKRHVTKPGRQAILNQVFDSLGVDDGAFKTRYSAAVAKLNNSDETAVVVDIDSQSVDVELRQAAPVDLDADADVDVDAWISEALDNTYSWVEGTFIVTDVSPCIQGMNGRKTVHREFTLEYASGDTVTMPVSIHHLLVTAEHI